MKWLRDDGSLQRSARTERDNGGSRPWKEETTEAKTIQLDRGKGENGASSGSFVCPDSIGSVFSMLNTNH